jgi:hypothetical protein
MMKIEGSGSIRQRHGSADPDPDPHQNVMDPQHCWVLGTLHISRVCIQTYRRLISGWMRERRLSRMTCGSVITLAWHRIIAT